MFLSNKFNHFFLTGIHTVHLLCCQCSQHSCSLPPYLSPQCVMYFLFIFWGENECMQFFLCWRMPHCFFTLWCSVLHEQNRIKCLWMPFLLVIIVCHCPDDKIKTQTLRRLSLCCFHLSIITDLWSCDSIWV